MTLPRQTSDLAVWSPQQIDGYMSAVRGVTDLRVFVLIRHIALEEWLRHVLARRLGADTLPDVRSFATLAGLALAGTQFRNVREAVGLFNKARNEIAHKMYSADPGATLAQFVKLVQERDWPSSEQQQIAIVSEAVGTLMVQIEQAI